LSDAPLIAASPRVPSEYGWSCSLTPDERLPEQHQIYIDCNPNPWAVDPGLFASYVTRTRQDVELRYEQTLWIVERFAARGYLLNGPAEAGTWIVQFPDGAVDYGYVLSCNLLDLNDISAKAAIVKHEAKFVGPPYPHGEGGRWAGSSAHDMWGRKGTVLWETK
jgi:hypothetical protein